MWRSSWLLHIGLTAQRSQNVGGDAGMVKVGFYHTLVFRLFLFCSAALLVERATKKQITAATASSTGITIQTLGAAGARATPPAITAAHKIRASTKKQATGRCVGMSSCYKVPPWEVYFAAAANPQEAFIVLILT